MVSNVYEDLEVEMWLRAARKQMLQLAG